MNETTSCLDAILTLKKGGIIFFVSMCYILYGYQYFRKSTIAF